MHENALQPLGSKQIQGDQRQQYSSFGLFSDVYGRNVTKSSAIVQPMTSHHFLTSQQQNANTPEKENQPIKPYHISPVMPVAGSVSHNIMRMLNESYLEVKKDQEKTTQPTYTGSNNQLPNYRQRLQYGLELEDTAAKAEDDNLAANDSSDHLRTSDLPNITDTSISTHGSSSPSSTGTRSSPSGSTNSSPGSGCEPAVSPDVTSQDNKKKNRTNYTTEQVQKLLKIFHDNPYPDSEMMEEIGKDMGIPENKIKIWFQNKRARWRRRVNDNMNVPQHLMAMSPMMPPMSPYGFMPPAHMMTSSSPHPFSGYMNYPWFQGPISPNNNHAQTSQMTSRLHSSNQTAQRFQQVNQNAFYGQSHLPASFQHQSPISVNPVSFSMKSNPQTNFLHSPTSRSMNQYSQCLYSSTNTSGIGGQSS